MGREWGGETTWRAAGGEEAGAEDGGKRERKEGDRAEGTTGVAETNAIWGWGVARRGATGGGVVEERASGVALR